MTLLCIKKYKGLCVGRRYRMIAYYPTIHKIKVRNSQGKDFVYKAECFRLFEKLKGKL
jgi:hypothetical protein